MEKYVFRKMFKAMWATLLFACCQLVAAAPTVNVTASPNTPTAPATVTLAVNATSDGSPVLATQVEYFNGTASLGVSLQSPFTLTLDNLAAGTYLISAKVTTTDPANPVLQSAPLAVTVGTAPGAATAYFIHTDQLNTPRAISSGSGDLVWQWDSDPFGKDAANEQPAGQPAFSSNLRFPGQQFDRESSLHYNYFRDYDPQTGRYAQSDPIGLKGGINTFAYVDGNPVSRRDPDGRLWAIVAPGIIVGSGLYLFKSCMEKCQAGKFCPVDGDSRKRYGQCASYCFNLTSLWMTVLDGGFANTKPAVPAPTSTAETAGAVAGANE